MHATAGALRLLALLGTSSSFSLVAQATPHATSVVAINNNGGAGGGIFIPSNLLGPPQGLVNSLGIGGDAIVGLGVAMRDGAGADLIVLENPFFLQPGPIGSSFCEMLYVEVSSNGIDFARFPSRYYGPQVQPGPFGTLNVGYFENLAGATPQGSGPDPQDLVEAGGDAFDLDDLRGDPLVLAGRVDLGAITALRLVDVRSGIDADARGRLIFDPGAGSADVDGVTVVHHQGNASPNPPIVDVVVPVDGSAEITLSDPDGLLDLDPASLRASIYGIPVPFAAILPIFTVVSATPTSVQLKLIGTLPPVFPLRLAVSVKDLAGNRSGDARSRPLN